MAVEDIASAMPQTSATVIGNPSATAIAATASAVATTCAAPMPKIERRSSHRRCGSSSRPIRNSSSTTPSSAKCSTVSGWVINPSPHGPIAMPAAR